MNTFLTISPGVVFRIESKVYGGASFKNSYQLFAANFLCKKAPPLVLDRVACKEKRNKLICMILHTFT